MRTHSKVHSGEKPFECKHCGKHFRLKGNLQAHEKTNCKSKTVETVWDMAMQEICSVMEGPTLEVELINVNIEEGGVQIEEEVYGT